MRADLKSLSRDIAGLTVTLARIEERTNGISTLDARVRTLEDKLSAVQGIGRATSQGITWALPALLALLGVLASVITFLLTRGHP